MLSIHKDGRNGSLTRFLRECLLNGVAARNLVEFVSNSGILRILLVGKHAFGLGAVRAIRLAENDDRMGSDFLFDELIRIHVVSNVDAFGSCSVITRKAISHGLSVLAQKEIMKHDGEADRRLLNSN